MAAPRFGGAAAAAPDPYAPWRWFFDPEPVCSLQVQKRGGDGSPIRRASDDSAPRRVSSGDPNERAVAMPHEARQSVVAVATLGIGGFSGDIGRVRRGLRGSVVCTTIWVSFVYQLLQSGGLGDVLWRQLIQSLFMHWGCWLDPY